MSKATTLVRTEWYGEHDGGLGDHDVIVAEADDATEEKPPWQSEPLAFLCGHDPYDAEVQAAVSTGILETRWPAGTTPPALDPYVVYDEEGEEIAPAAR